MNEGQPNQPLQLSRTSIFLLVTMLFYLLFAGFIVAVDLYYYNDPDSAVSVLMIYGLMGILTSIYIAGKRYGLIGLIIISAVLLVSQVGYIIAYVTAPVIDPSAHSPFANLFESSENLYLAVIVFIVFHIIFAKCQY